MIETPKAIETEWNGTRFRSRLEARWAIYFTEMGFRWEYEAEGFNLPGGERYLPDFRLNGKTYAEVKPEGGDFSKLRLLAKAAQVPTLECEGPPPGLRVARAARAANGHRFWEAPRPAAKAAPEPEPKPAPYRRQRKPKPSTPKTRAQQECDHLLALVAQRGAPVSGELSREVQKAKQKLLAAQRESGEDDE